MVIIIMSTRRDDRWGVFVVALVVKVSGRDGQGDHGTLTRDDMQTNTLTSHTLTHTHSYMTTHIHTHDARTLSVHTQAPITYTVSMTPRCSW